MATRDELMTALRNADAAGDTEAARRIAAMVPSEEPTEAPAAPPASFGQRVGQGAADLAAGFGKVGSYLLAPYDLAADTAQGRQLGTGHRERMGAIKGFAAEHGANDFTSDLNQGAPEMVGLAGGAARFLPDVALNAAWEGSKAAAAGEPILPAAARGGLGAAGGRVLMRALAGSKPLISESARRLVDNNVMPTPGQLFDGPVGTFAARIEDKATSIPGAGEVIDHARRRGLREYGRAEVNAALTPLAGGKGVTATGADAIEAAQRQISAAYDSALDGMVVSPGNVAKAITDTGRSIKSIALLDDTQAAKLARYAEQRLAAFAQPGAPALNGAEAKALDSEIGHYARQFSRSVNPADRPLGEAFYALQQQWRAAMASGATPDKVALLNAANAAHRNLLPLVKASDKAMAQKGVFTPHQLQRSYAPTTRAPQSGLNKAAQDVLPSRVPDSGSAGRLLLAGAVGAGVLYTAPVAAGLAAIAYSRPAMNMFLHGVGSTLPASAKQHLAKLPPKQAMEYLADISQRFAHIRGPIAAQVGRMMALDREDDQGEEATQ